MKDTDLFGCTDAALKEAVSYLTGKLNNVRALCSLVNVNLSVYYTYKRQMEAGQRPTMAVKSRKRFYEAALRLKAEEAEAIKKLQEEEK